jgi:hypothetical protein
MNKFKSMTPLKQTTVYVPIPVETEYPEQDVKTIFYRGELDTRIGSRGMEQPFTHWLKPTSGYLLTSEELERIISDTWNACMSRVVYEDQPNSDMKEKYKEVIGEPLKKNEYLKKVLP